MFSLIDECAENFANYFETVVKFSVLEIDVKDTITRFTTDVIATTAFGIKCDSINDRDNEFFVKGKKALNFSGVKTVLKLITMSIFPQLARVSYVPIIFIKP